MRVKHLILLILIAIGVYYGPSFFKGDVQRVPADLSFQGRENSGAPNAQAEAKAPENPSEKVALAMANYLEQKQNAENLLFKWGDYSQSRGFDGFEQEISRYLKETSSDKALRVLLVINRKSSPGQSGGEGDFQYVAAAEQELRKNPIASIAAMKGALEAFPRDGFSEERSYLLQLVGRVAQTSTDQNVISAAKAIYLSEIQQANQGNAGGDANLPIMAMTSYMQLETDPKARETAEQLLSKNHPDPGLAESYRAFNVPPPPPPPDVQYELPPPSADAQFEPPAPSPPSTAEVQFESPPPPVETAANGEIQAQLLQQMQQQQLQQQQLQQQQQQENGEVSAPPPVIPENQSF